MLSYVVGTLVHYDIMYVTLVGRHDLDYTIPLLIMAAAMPYCGY